MAQRKRDAQADGGIGAGPAVEVMQASGDVAADASPEQQTALYERARARLEKDLRAAADAREEGAVEVVVGDPRWDAFTDPDGAARLRCTVQGHLERV
jgi:hypothetical protein